MHMFSTGAVVIPPPHKAGHIAKCVSDILQEFGFAGDYNISCTTDSGSNIVNALDE